MDMLSNPEVEEVVMCCSAQLGKTELLNNIVGYHADRDPGPMLVVMPTIEMGHAWSEDRLAPMIRDTPALKAVFKEEKARDGGNTKARKEFIGGQITIAGANSPASLCGRPIRIVLQDEVDRFPPSAGKEGDPCDLADTRASNFWDRKKFKSSTPTLKGQSRIMKAYRETDQRKFFVPCPHCGHSHLLLFPNLRWDNDNPETARMECPRCREAFTNAQKNAAVRLGKYEATAPSRRGRVGYWLNSLYSPWLTLAEIVDRFLKAKGDPEKLKVFTNTVLAEEWEDDAQKADFTRLQERCEPYTAEVPEGGLILTFGADCQPDRIECEVVAWGRGLESWSIDYRVFHGDIDIFPGDANSPWTEFFAYLGRTFNHAGGVPMIIKSGFVDSGGAGGNTRSIYKAMKGKNLQGWFIGKGRGGAGVPIIGPPSKPSIDKRGGATVDLYIIGVDAAKDQCMQRLLVEEPGPGYCHFPEGRGIDYFRQLTAERKETTYRKGHPFYGWVKDSGQRNEAWDCRVYNYAAIIKEAPHFDGLAKRLKERIAETRPKEYELKASQPKLNQPKPEPKKAGSQPVMKHRYRSNYMNAW